MMLAKPTLWQTYLFPVNDIKLAVLPQANVACAKPAVSCKHVFGCLLVAKIAFCYHWPLYQKLARLLFLHVTIFLIYNAHTRVSQKGTYTACLVIRVPRHGRNRSRSLAQ